MEERGLVLVTGGSGYIAGFCIAQLMRESWRVRTTVRWLKRGEAVHAALSKLAEPGDQLAFVVADLNSDAGWAEAVAGCDYVLHIAAPLPSGRSRSDDDLVRPARDGALRVLTAARSAGVKRVVMTSSIAAIAYGHGSRQTPFTEADWSDDTNLADTSAYERSKTIAERAAWAWMKQHGTQRPDLGRRVPTRRLPDWMLKFGSLFDPMLREHLFELGKKRPVSNEKARVVLDWSPRPTDETVIDTADSLVAFGIV